ncbi:hypothetical protein [Dubosiella newyorkensis]|uniref:hypothetical protein n=1 Tax=Dubosiella newyorkensis TaxID=1862672 RepID=UPI003F670C65
MRGLAMLFDDRLISVLLRLKGSFAEAALVAWSERWLHSLVYTTAIVTRVFFSAGSYFSMQVDYS